MYLAFKGYRAATSHSLEARQRPRALTRSTRAGVRAGHKARGPHGYPYRSDEGARDVRPRYAEREAIEADLQEARAIMRRIGCLVIHTEDRAVEESAQEIIRHLAGDHLTRD